MAKAPGKSGGSKSTGSKSTASKAGGARAKPTATRGAAKSAARPSAGPRAAASRATAKAPASAKATARSAATRPDQHRTGWSKDDVKELRALVKSNTPTPLMAYKLQRTVHATRAKARELGISLKPINRSPYGRVKK